MKSLILIGPQGSGKGTQAKLLAAEFGYTIFETGGVLRTIAKEDSELGNQVREITTRGDLVPNEVVMDIVEKFIGEHKNTPIIFDGIPRSEEQRQSLEKLLEQHQVDFTAVEIALPIDRCMDRLLKRAEIEGRADDNPESIRNRLKNFFTYTEPLLEFWAERKKLVTVSGDGKPEEVHKIISEKLNLK